MKTPGASFESLCVSGVIGSSTLHQGMLTVSAKDWGTSQEKSIRIEETGTVSETASKNASVGEKYEKRDRKQKNTMI